MTSRTSMNTSGLRSRLGGAPRHPDQRNKGQGALEETSANTEAASREVRCSDALTALKCRWPVVVVVAGVSAALLGERHPPRAEAAAYWFVLVVVGPILCTLDVALLRLPDAIVLPAAPSVLLLIAASAFAHGNPAEAIRALAAGTLSGAVLAGLAILSRGGLGWGDVKVSAGLLGPLLGCAGWWALAEAALFGFACAGVTGLLTPRRRAEIRRLPLGPFLFGATLAVVLVNPLR
ncbi:prepilin peptidase [Streptacidiphilus pinicola]|uniref:prepilin peptidase n=1 Tax=Streptacidiphilus pinicola TaxID=2219663 RepID=UPI001057A155|nr:A24 family peptidase [Streptacidiphilus pinicola]